MTRPTTSREYRAADKLAQLEDLAAAREKDTDHRRTLVLLGDVLRLGGQVPAPVRRQVFPSSREQLEALCSNAAASLDAVELPPPGGDSRALAVAARARDEVESILTASLRSCMSQRLVPGDIDGYQRLRDVAASVADELLRNASTEAIAEALGERAWLDDGPVWYQLREDEAEAPVSEPGLAVESHLPGIRGERPPISILAEYVTRGSHHRWVEAAAERWHDFAEELELLVDSTRAARDTVSFMARCWLKRRRDEVAVTIALPSKLAASSEQADDIIVPLGELAPLQAEGRLVAGRHVVLEIDAAPDGVSRVQLGANAVDKPDEDGVWRVRADAKAGVLPLRVEASDGTVVASDVEIELAEDDDGR